MVAAFDKLPVFTECVVEKMFPQAFVPDTLMVALKIEYSKSTKREWPEPIPFNFAGNVHRKVFPFRF
jgi:hypothetical protein